MPKEINKLTIKQVGYGLLWLFGLQSLIAAVATLMIPTDPKNNFLLGYSLPRLALVSWFLLACVGFFWLAWQGTRNNSWMGAHIRFVFSRPGASADLSAFFLMLLAISITMIVTPPTYPALWSAYFIRLRPLIFWLGLVSCQALIGLVYVGAYASLARLTAKIKRHKRTFIASGLFSITFGLVWGWIAKTGVGLRGQWAFWNEAGVPLLAGQILQVGGWVVVLVLLNALLARRVRARQVSWGWVKIVKYQDLLVGLALWLVAAVVWLQTPLAVNFFAPGPYPPDYAYFPYSDAATWNMDGQTALIGEGIAYGNTSADHTALAGFYAVLHLLVGQDFNRIVAWQTIIYACFPVLLYAFGKALHNWATGLFLAGLVIVRSANAIAAGGMINLSHVKLLLTEVPTGLGLALLALWLFRWLKNTERHPGYSLAVGAVMAGLILLRFNTLTFPLAVLIGTALFYDNDSKTWIKDSAFMLLASILVLSPWMWHSWQISGTPLFFAVKSQHILVDGYRYFLPPEPTPVTPSSDILRSVPHDALVTNNIEELQADFLFDTNTTPINGLDSGPKDQSFIITNHFIHNIVTSVMILPTIPELRDLRATIHEGYPYWNKIDPPWAGALSTTEIAGLSINLALIALGLGISWRKWGLAGWVPLGIFLTYNLSTAFAGTSGGRYIVPVDWVVLLYYAIGLVQLITWGLRFFGLMPAGEGSLPVDSSFSYRQGVLLMLPFLLFTSAMTIIDRVIPQRYPDLTEIEILERLQQEDLLAQTGYDFDELEVFLQDSGGQAYLGRALYPRFLNSGQGESTASDTVYDPKDYPRLAFSMIGNFGVYYSKDAIIHLAKSPEYFPHAVDVIVIGCKNSEYDYTDALVVAVLGEQKFAYTRLSETPLYCPFEELHSQE